MKYFIKKIIKDESGQSLVEILVALTIGALLIGAASTAVVTVLQSGTTSQRHQSATILSQDYLEKIRTHASSDWHNVYNLSKGPNNLYHFGASSTDVIAVKGQEGVIDNDIRGNLAGYWSLDEASSTVSHDKSGNGNNGTINGATATSTDCRVGRCFSFDGVDDYINMGNDSSLQISDIFTVSFWVKINDLDDHHELVTKGRGLASPGDKGWAISYSQSGLIYFDTYESDGTRHALNSLDYPQDNNWHYLACTFDNGDKKCYLDSSTSTIESGSYAIGNTSYDLHVSDSSQWQAFDGMIDDVRIYNKALLEEDIDHLYNSATFTRHFYVEDVCRTNDADYEIAGVKPCDPGEKEDPSTQKVTVVVKWGDTGEFILDDYVTRWRNRVFPQEDWSGGAGFEGPVTEPTDRYSTSTDISTSTEGLQIEGI